MLPKGTLTRVQDFFFHSSSIEREMQRAGEEFFGSSFDDGELPVMSETQEGILTEWLTFDFKLENGNGLIEEFYRSHPLTEAELNLYYDLLNTNRYGLFEVRGVVLGERLALRDVATGDEYEVWEKSATYELRKGNLIFNRVARVNGHWELVGADGPMIPAVSMTAAFRKMLREGKHPVTPKTAFGVAGRDSDHWEDELESIHPEQARKRFARMLEKTGLNQFVSVDTVERWCREMKSVNASSHITSLLAGLLGNEPERPPSEFIGVITEFYNTVPQNRLKGMSPKEMRRKLRDKPAQLRMSVTALGGERWFAQIEKAHRYMRGGDWRRAVAAFENTFALLEKEWTVPPDAYRIYANKAICHFHYGEALWGAAMLAVALLLNPNYDFGQRVAREYQEGKLEEVIERGMMRQVAFELPRGWLRKKGKRRTHAGSPVSQAVADAVKEKVAELEIDFIPAGSDKKMSATMRKLAITMERQEWERIMESPSLHYCQRITDLGITLKTATLTRSKITTYNQEGEAVRIGRNAPCPCGSGKKYKKCCGA